jgi:carboxylesterase
VYPENEKDPDRRAIGMEYWAKTDLFKVSDMMVLRKRALTNLREVDSPTLTIVSEGDKTVAPDAVQIIEKGISSTRKEHLILKESPHVLVNGLEKELVADRIIDWFRKE